MTDPSATEPSVTDLLAAVVKELGGQDRPGQIEMATRVAKAFDEKHHLVVQAGTGTGKSLGYLVPALLHEKRVIVATATLALQHQLVDRDLPALIAAARPMLERDPTYALIKGRSNYACLNRVRDGNPDDEQDALVDLPPTSGLASQVLELRSWAEEQAEAGRIADKDSAPPHADRAWRHVSVSARECLGERCAYFTECFTELAREEAAHADVVVTNHALLAIDAIDEIPMLPAHDAVVIDEAHELVARVTQAATRELTSSGVERAARAARPFVDDLQADELAEASAALSEEVAGLSDGRLEPPPESLRLTLQVIHDATRTMLSQIAKAEKDEEPHPARQLAKAQLTELRATSERMAAGSQTDVLWRSAGHDTPELHIAPLDVAAALRDKLFANRDVVLTSATLTVGGTFHAIGKAVGLAGSDHDWDAVDVGSPFDYGRQGILYVAKHLPPPGREGMNEAVVDEIVGLIEAAGGRTLGLFSSRRAAEYAAEQVRERLPGLDLWCQGDAQLSDLTRRFVEKADTCLFGTLSLWQGVDVPGETCQLVIIDRIPFPRPDDPLMSARARRAERSGGNGFMDVSAAHAALLLAQGSGRLIRTPQDRGVVAVLDSRLATARYGDFLARSMPPMWRTTDGSVARDALNRLAAPVGP